jgi:hypothetical protein
VPQVHVTLPEMQVHVPPAQVVVNVPEQKAPIVNVTPAIAVTAEVKLPDVTETIEVVRDQSGAMTGATKRRRSKG